MTNEAIAHLQNRPIVRLDDNVINQIAAGEVVERPSSVVKELVENALDAGARRVAVLIEQGGLAAIEVIDNGCGMEPSDAELAVERFATSKVRLVDDLFAISTLGFRGEALASIASVSKFSLRTGTSDGRGTLVLIDGGAGKQIQEAVVSRGTRIRVERLFHNVPARRRFLRSPQTETSLIKSLMIDFALGYPTVSFSLVSEGREILSVSESAGFQDRARTLKVAGARPICFESLKLGGYSVQGFLSQPADAAIGAQRLRFLVNGRIVKDKTLLKAVRDAYGTFLRPGQYPTGVVRVEIPAEDLDVNVHPQKAEVRFRDSQRLYLLLANSVRQHLNRLSADASPAGTESPGQPERGHGLAERPLALLFRAASGVSEPLDSRIAVDSQSIATFATFAAGESVEDSGSATQRRRYLGQIFRCFLIFADESMLYLLDMHAAHERVVFFRLKQQAQSGQIRSQLLLTPELVELPPGSVAYAEESVAVLRRVGFDCELFGDGTFVVRAVPSLLGARSVREILNDLMSEPAWAAWGQSIERHLDDVLSRLACHGSIRAGREIEAAEAYALLDALAEAEASALCPHGRPVIREFSRREVENLFARS